MDWRTDLAVEEKELWENSPQNQTKLEGVAAREYDQDGIHTTEVRILTQEGGEKLRKPVGTYVTLELEALMSHERQSFERCAGALSAALRAFLTEKEHILVVGLGNDAISPDSIGPSTLKNLIVTRHLKTGAAFSDFRTVSAFQPGVIGCTGIESLELVQAVVSCVHPEQILVVDALAAASSERICRSVQLTDTGIVPGSGVGNSRCAFTAESLGVPVVAIGIPTVASVRIGGGAAEAEIADDLMITAKDIDDKAAGISKLLGYGINLALHRGLSIDDVACFLS